MAIVVEDGTQVAGANSYISEAELTTYASDRGITLTETESVLIYKSMDYLETLRFSGERVSDDQALSWPREGAYVDGVEVAKDEIPNRLTDAQLALCASIDAGNSPDGTLGQGVKREKVDVIEIEYQDGSVDAAVLRKVNNLLRPILIGGTGAGATFNVTRG